MTGTHLRRVYLCYSAVGPRIEIQKAGTKMYVFTVQRKVKPWWNLIMLIQKLIMCSALPSIRQYKQKRF